MNDRVPAEGGGCWPWSHRWSRWLEERRDRARNLYGVLHLQICQERECLRCGMAQTRTTRTSTGYAGTGSVAVEAVTNPATSGGDAR